MSKTYAYAVVVEGVQESSIDSLWTTPELAGDRVAQLIAKMPKASRDSWQNDPAKRGTTARHCGSVVGVWGCLSFGPCTNHIAALVIRRMVIGQGDAITRLAHVSPRTTGN